MKRWTKGEDETLLCLRDNGFQNKEIADKLGRTLGSVWRRLSALKLATPRINSWTPREREKLESLCAKRLPIADIAERMGRTPAAVRMYAEKHGVERVKRLRTDSSWTAERAKQAETLWLGGKSLTECAEALDISRGAMSSFVNRMRQRGIVRDVAVTNSNRRAMLRRMNGGNTKKYKRRGDPPEPSPVSESVAKRARADAEMREKLRQLIYMREPDNMRKPGGVYQPKFVTA